VGALPRGKFYPVARFGLRFTYRARCEFEHRVRGETGRQPPRTHAAPDLFHSQFAIQVNEIDGELHAERVDRLAGPDPQAFSRPEFLASQQTLPSLRAVIRNLHAMGEHRLAGEVRDPETKILFCLAAPSEAVEERANRFHAVAALSPFSEEMLRLASDAMTHSRLVQRPKADDVYRLSFTKTARKTILRLKLLQVLPNSINAQTIRRAYRQQVHDGQETVHECECPRQMQAEYT
jgi:hypothetical protein